MPTVRVNGTDLFYERHGSGPPILFSSGLGGHGGYWHVQVQDLSRYHEVIVFDHRGIGRSGPADPPFSVSGLASDVIGLMDALALAEVAFVGHSTGGAMGQWLAANHPDRFRALVLSATWAGMDPRLRLIFETRKEILSRLDGKAYVRQSLPLTYPPDWFDSHGDRLADLIEASVRELPPVEVVSARLDAIIASDHAGGPIDTELPVLVLSAADDALLPPSYGADVAARFRSAEFRRLDTGGHHFPQTRALRFNDMLTRFLGSAGG